MNDSLVWPYDCFKTFSQPDRLHPGHLVCFLICPFKPKDLYEALYNYINDIFKKINTDFVCEIQLKR